MYIQTLPKCRCRGFQTKLTTNQTGLYTVQLTVCKLSSLSRYQPRAGPDGGDGGRGGSIVLIADNSVKEFAHLPKHIKAENGGNGRGDDCKGKNGSDRTFQVNMQNYFCL